MPFPSNFLPKPLFLTLCPSTAGLENLSDLADQKLCTDTLRTAARDISLINTMSHWPKPGLACLSQEKGPKQGLEVGISLFTHDAYVIEF